MYNLTLNQILQNNYQAKGNRIAVYKEFLNDMETPFSILMKIYNKNSYCFLLESAVVGFYRQNDRYSFVGVNPYLIMKFKDGIAEINRNGKEEKTNIYGHPLDFIREEINKINYITQEDVSLPFVGGAVGYMGYDTIKYYEKIELPKKDDLKIYEGICCFYDYFIVFDNFHNSLKIVGLLPLDGNIRQNYKTVINNIENIERKIKKKTDIKSFIPIGMFDFSSRKINKLKFKSNITRDYFTDMVKKAKKYIRAGDIFQVVLSQRFSLDLKINPIEIYRVLRSMNPSPYMFYLNFIDYQILGASPEVMIRVVDGNILLCPLAGTRPRGKNEEEDKKYEQELINSEKERAEHIMLVDLGRNDVGRVAKPGTVKVENLMHFLKFSHVQHLNSEVKGVLADDKNVYDAFKSALPRGTVSGAPKIRAMEIISELEKDRRLHYGGAVCYFSFNGNMDSAIMIRTLLVKQNKIYVQAGAGIVADSIPEHEYKETINKSMGLLKAVETAKEIQAKKFGGCK